MSPAGYSSPTALRAAITDRLRALAKEDGAHTLQDLLRQFAYDRLLYRVFSGDEADHWVLKGATALLARLHGAARHSVDIDLYSEAPDLEEAERALQVAASRRVDDYFRFELSPGRRIAEGGVALRIPVVAYLGATEFARFNVDLVTGVGMTGKPDEVEPLVPIELPGIERTSYRAYPVADHIADKVMAIVEPHSRRDGPAVASTRYRDLADLLVMAGTQEPEAGAVIAALRAQAERRRVDLPSTFSAPTGSGWEAGYARVARGIAEVKPKELGAAVESVRAFIDPVLRGTARGRWDRERGIWE